MIQKLLVAMVRLYPLSIREEFGEEIRADLAEMQTDFCNASFFERFKIFFMISSGGLIFDQRNMAEIYSGSFKKCSIIRLF